MSTLLQEVGNTARFMARQGLVLGVVLGLTLGSLALAAVERARA